MFDLFKNLCRQKSPKDFFEPAKTSAPVVSNDNSTVSVVTEEWNTNKDGHCWAIYGPDWKDTPGVMIFESSVRRLRRQAINEFLERPYVDLSWKKLYRKGFRCERVFVEKAHG